jgi:hypothetical protein
MNLSDWTRAYLRDARESDAIDRDTPDAVIDREAAKLDVLIFKVASSFVDNEFIEDQSSPLDPPPEGWDGTRPLQ